MNDPVMSRADSSLDAPQSWSSFFFYLAIAAVLALGIRTYVVAPYIVVGQSMEPTFFQYHYLLIDKLTYQSQEPVRGEVVVLDLPHNESRALIKRIIGLPGETISVRGNDVFIVNNEFPEGFKLNETYVIANNLGGPTDVVVTLKNDEYFVLGDNRRVSSDSRTWGVLPRHDIKGRVLVRLFPFASIDIFPGVAVY